MTHTDKLLAALITVVTCSGALASSGCGGSGWTHGTYSESGFRHSTHDYEIVFRREGGLAPADWRLVNFLPSADDTLGEPKSTPAFTYLYAMDFDGDDRPDYRSWLNRYDLAFEHRRNDGEMWVSTLPISETDRERNLDVMLRDMVENVSGTGRVYTSFGQQLELTGRRYATRILESRPIVHREVAGHEVLFEVANVEQLEVSPDARWKRARVILLRPGFTFNPAVVNRSARANHFFPVLLMLGYANHPDDFAEGDAHFQDLVSRLYFA